MKPFFYFIILIPTFIFCLPKNNSPDSLHVGMTMDEIQQVLSKPDRVDSVEKNTEIIWGAEEAFWDELPIGARLEIWIYKWEENELRLYFINDSDTLSYKIVAPKDAVYESVD
jgi:hypothetical protein